MYMRFAERLVCSRKGVFFEKVLEESFVMTAESVVVPDNR